MGLSVCGFDLNPVMIVVAKAPCLDPVEYTSLNAERILKVASSERVQSTSF
jgi:hypothetical protein